MSGLTLITSPSGEPILIDEMKDHLRISIDDDDKDVERITRVARRWCEKMQNRSYMTQTWDLYYDDFPSTPFELPRAPLQSVTHIKYFDTDDAETTVGSTTYRIDVFGFAGRVNLKDGEVWPNPTLRTLNGVVVRFQAGYGNRASVPEEVTQAIKLMAGHFYEHREETIPEKFQIEHIPFGVFDLLDLERVITFP